MALYYVLRTNDYFKRGTVVRDADPGFVQRTLLTNEGASGWQGLQVPLHAVRPYLVKLLKRGLDFRRGGALG